MALAALPAPTTTLRPRQGGKLMDDMHLSGWQFATALANNFRKICSGLSAIP
jgi:hypothetical protein